MTHLSTPDIGSLQEIMTSAWTIIMIGTMILSGVGMNMSRFAHMDQPDQIFGLNNLGLGRRVDS